MPLPHNLCDECKTRQPLPRDDETRPMSQGRLSQPPTSVGHIFDLRRSRVPGPRRPSVSRYRVFMTIVFVCVVFIDQWSDRNLSAAVSTVVGPVSVILWVLTLLGSFEIGPVAAMWRSVSR